MNKKLAEILDSNGKSQSYKQAILAHMLQNGQTTLSSITKALDISLPTANKFVNDLLELGLVQDYGKLETTGGGRHPNLYGLCPESVFFMGVDFGVNTINIALMDFCGNIVIEEENRPFKFENTPECLKAICQEIKNFLSKPEVDENKVYSVGVNIFGRVNPKTGYSYSYFNFYNEPLSDYFTKNIGIDTFIDNDARACAFGEYMTHYLNVEPNMIFVNATWGLGLGIIIEGKPYNGKSGFAGEFGHIHAYKNEILCKCGKKGCLETEASGSAIYRKFVERIKSGSSSTLLTDGRYTVENIEDVTLDDILDATIKEDILCIEILEEIGQELGMHLSSLINIFNPNVVVLGGVLCRTGDYIIQPLRTAIRKYSLNMVNQDTSLRLSKLMEKAGVVGAAMLARKKVFDTE